MCISRGEHLQERKQKAQRREHSGPLANRKASVTAVCSYFYLYLVILTVQRRFLDETSNHLLTEKTVYFLFLNSLWGRAAGLGENQVYLVGPGGKGLWTTRKETPNHKIQFSFFPLGSGGWRERGKQRERERTVKKPLLWNLNKSSQNEGKHLGLQLLDVKECLRVGCPCISPRVSIFRVATQSFFNSGARTLLRKPWPWRNMKLFEEHSEREGRVVKDEVRYRDKSQTI